MTPLWLDPSVALYEFQDAMRGFPVRVEFTPMPKPCRKPGGGRPKGSKDTKPRKRRGAEVK